MEERNLFVNKRRMRGTSTFSHDRCLRNPPYQSLQAARVVDIGWNIYQGTKIRDTERQRPSAVEDGDAQVPHKVSGVTDSGCAAERRAPYLRPAWGW